MIKALAARLRQGHRTMRFPAAPPPPMPAKYRGLPAIDGTGCAKQGSASCSACLESCPVGALSFAREGPGAGGGAPAPSLDLGSCIFCGACAEACPAGAIEFGGDHRLAVRRREDLLLVPGSEGLSLATALEGRIRRLLGRSLKLREVSAGGCNACEADVNVLGTVGWDLGRFGIQFVASPRHADGLLLTGPVTANMELALRKTWDAIPGPKVAIAVGACAISGGIYAKGEGADFQTRGGGEGIIPVDLFIPGCPPHPLTILDGLLRLVGRMERRGDLPAGRKTGK